MKTSDSWHICYLSDAATIHTQRWARHFAQRGHRVTVISFRPKDIRGVNVIYIKPATNWPRLNYILSSLTVRRLIRKLQPDVLHAHYATSYGLLGAIAGWHPFVVTAWGTDVLITPVESTMYRCVVRWVFKRADLVTSMADHMTADIQDRGYAEPGKVITLPFGVDTDLFHPRHRLQPHGGPPFLVLSTRRLDKVCDVQTYIRAAPLVLCKIPDVKFVVGSDGPLRAELETLATELGLSEELTFTGWLPLEEMLRLLGEADVLVSTSWSDGNNVTLNEGMACGAFPVATNIPANCQWVDAGRNGYLFPPGDWHALAECVVEALENPDLRNNAAQMNWEIVSRRASWQRSMERMERHYRSMIGER